MKILGTAFFSALICFCVNGTAPAEPPPYVPLSSAETADFERGLYKLLPVYAYGVGISDSRWATGVKADRLGPKDAAHLAKYQTKIASWFDDIVVEDLRPDASKKTAWPMFRGLRPYRGGRYA